MILPEDFQFTTVSLQDFVDCPRRFFLRYVRDLRSPAPESSSLRALEAEVERSDRFHHLIYQHQIGIPAKALQATISDDVIADWWDAYLKHPPTNLPANRRANVTLSAPLAGRRLVAKYDLLAFEPDRAVIVEWKTAPSRIPRELLQRRLQTIVYPYLLAKAGAHLNGGKPFAPDAINMIYWFAEQPEQPEIFAYSAELFAADQAYLEGLAGDILRRGEDEFELTDNTDLCQFCAYRALNGRGVKAGDLLASDADPQRESFGFRLDLDQIAEIEF